jgi:hypothetical protein
MKARDIIINKRKHPPKFRSVVQWLNSEYGKGWSYDHNFGWTNKDGRTVRRVATGKDYFGEYDGTWSYCMYFNNGETPPKWI